MLRVFFGQHKCASQWVTLVIERICNELGWKSVYAYEKVRTEHGGLRALINDENPDFLIIPESNVELVGEIDRPFQGFHVIRDPRDIVVSGYFSHKGSHLLSPAGVTMEHREKLQTLPKLQPWHRSRSVTFISGTITTHRSSKPSSWRSPRHRWKSSLVLWCSWI
jgi:hypothetical protein